MLSYRNVNSSASKLAVFAKQPFLLYLPFNTPHTPFQAPERNWVKFKDKEIDLLDPSGRENINETRAALAMIDNIDENVGRIIAKIEELGIDDNTIILYFHDNGAARPRWNAGMMGRKGSIDEGGSDCCCLNV